MKISVDRVKQIVKQYSEAHVLVLGDLMLDTFIWGEVRRISPEAPVPVVEVDRESTMPGGSANVVNNICAMGGKCSVGGVIGGDTIGRELLHELKDEGAFVDGVIVDESRKTTVKTRIIARHQQVVRFDRENKEPLSGAVYDKVIDYIASAIDKVDAVIIEDYGKGFLSGRLARYCIDLCKKTNTIVTFDPKMGHELDVKGLTAVTPNKEEALAYAGHSTALPDQLNHIGDVLLEKWDANNILMTLGDKGMCLFSKGEKPFSIPTVAKEVFDVSGAGDTVIGAFTLSLAGGANPQEAAILANYAAGIVVGKLGTGVTTAEEIIRAIESDE